MTKILRLSPETQDYFDCSPCFFDLQRDVKAVVLVVQEDRFGFCQTPMCGNHAEGIDNPEIDAEIVTFTKL